jgi:hypothetical protein
MKHPNEVGESITSSQVVGIDLHFQDEKVAINSSYRLVLNLSGHRFPFGEFRAR